MTDSAQVFTGVHDTPVYTDLLFNRPMRLWVAAPLVILGGLTVILAATNLDSGYSRWILAIGALATALACGAGALVPRGRPTLVFRIRCALRTLRPTTYISTPPA
jgi:hypothetical protein